MAALARQLAASGRREPAFAEVTREDACRRSMLDGDEDSRCMALMSIPRMCENPAEYVSYIMEAIEDSSAKVRVAGLAALSGLDEGARAGEWRRQLAHKDDRVRRGALGALARMGEDAFAQIEPVGDVLRSGASAEMRAAAMAAMGSMGSSKDVPVGLADEDPGVLAAAATAAGLCAGAPNLEGCLANIAELLAHADCSVRAGAVGALVRFGAEASPHAGRVAQLLQDEASVVREAAVRYFEGLGALAIGEAESMAEMLGHDDGRFQAAAAMALGCVRAGQFAEAVAGLLSSEFEDELNPAQAAAGAEPLLPPALRRPACAAALALARMGKEGAKFVHRIAAPLEGEELPADEVAATLVQALGLAGVAALAHEETILTVLESQPGYKPPVTVRAAACLALGELARAQESDLAAAAVAKQCRHAHAAVREAAARAHGWMPETGQPFSDDVARLLSDRIASVQVAALRALAAFGRKGEMYASEICPLMTNDVLDVQLAAVAALGGMGARGATFADEVALLLDDASPYVREAALHALANFAEEAEAHLPRIEAAATLDPEDFVREAAEGCLAALR